MPYGGLGTQADLDNHANQLNPNHSEYRGLSVSRDSSGRRHRRNSSRGQCPINITRGCLIKLVLILLLLSLSIYYIYFLTTAMKPLISHYILLVDIFWASYGHDSFNNTPGAILGRGNDSYSTHVVILDRGNNSYSTHGVILDRGNNSYSPSGVTSGTRDYSNSTSGVTSESHDYSNSTSGVTSETRDYSNSTFGVTMKTSIVFMKTLKVTMKTGGSFDKTSGKIKQNDSLNYTP